MHDLNFITTLSVGKRAKPRIKRIEYIWQMIWGTRAEQMGAVQRLWEVSEECYFTNGWDKTSNTLKEMAIWVWIKCWNCTPKNNWFSTFKSKDFSQCLSQSIQEQLVPANTRAMWGSHSLCYLIGCVITKEQTFL